MKKIRIIICSTFIFSLMIGINGFSQKSFTLEEAKQFAVKNSYKAKDAQIDLLLANQQIKQIIGSGLPQINANFDYNYFADVPKSPFPAEFFGGEPGTFVPVAFSPIHNFSAGISGSMVLLDASYFLGLQTTRMYKELSTQQRDKGLQDVKSDVVRSYYLCVIAKENIGVLEESIKTLDQNLNETKALQANGFAELLDVEQLTLVVANTRNILERNINQLLIAEKFLKLNMGYPIDEEITLTDNLESLENDKSNDYISTTNNLDINNNLDYKLMTQTMLLNKKNYQIELTKSLPSIRVGASFSRSAINNENVIFFDRQNSRWFAGGTVIFFSMNVPIFSSLIRDANIKSAKLNFQKANNQRDMLGESLKISFQNNKSEYEISMKQFQTEKNNLELAERIRNTNRVKFKEGMISSLELSQAENQYLQTRGNYFQALLNLMNAKLEFDKLTNKL